MQELHNDMILPIYEGGIYDARTVDGKIYIWDTPIRKYMPKHIKPTSNRNNITCGYQTYLSAMLLQSDLKKWNLSQLVKLDKLYINYASTRLLQISKNDFIE